MTVHPSELAAVTQPVTNARGLPNAFYTDPEVFEEEKRKVFFRNWAALGFFSDVPEPGDAKPLTFLGQPLVLIRGRDGVLRVFQNVCRHRGMILIERPQKIERAIRCPYHSWCYELDGSLRTTPHVGGPGTNRHDAIKRDELGLFEVRSHTWLGMVFVNIDGQAPAFEEYAGDAIARYADFDKPLYKCGGEGTFTMEVKANWKLAIENGAESYHLPWVHPGLNSYSRLEDHYHIEAHGPLCGQGTTVYNPSLSEDGRRFPEFADFDAKWNQGAEYPMLFPNIMIGVHKDQLWGFIVEPVSHDRSIEHVQIYYADPSVAGDAWAGMRKKNAEMWAGVFAEDIFVVEGMQRGRHATQFDGGKFSPVMDNPTHDFHAWVASQMMA
ncbi:MAG: aromatic ring-hydroxylating dioxygenase subunit alpha [Paracoccaceae bacterium]|nr:aromatic ring-hydroxylating dioxygenase subunit alpha [Paracoccaceae bacterium]